MKQKLCLFFFLIYSYLVFCQSTEWKSFDTPNKNSVLLLYQSKDGYLFGNMSDSYAMVYSEDYGETWRDLDLIKQNHFRRSTPFKEDKSGNLYFFNENIVYKFNKLDKKFIEFILIGSNEDIEDMAILYNRDIVVAHSRELILFSPSGIRKKSHEWWTHSAVFLIDENMDSKNYVTNSHGASYELWEFSSDISYVGNKKYIGYKNQLRIGDRLISDGQYSDNGGTTWKSFSHIDQNYINSSNIGADGKLYLSTPDKIFISGDAGESFTTVNHSIVGRIEYVSAFNNFLVAKVKEFCTYKIYSSNNNGISWNEIKNDIGYYYTSKVFPALNEKLYINNCLLKQKENEFLPWENLNIETEQFGMKNPELIFTLSNNTILCDVYSMFYISYDNGKQWQKLPNRPRISYYDHEYVEKNGTLFHLENDSLHYSEDFALTWKRLPLNSSQIYNYYYKTEFTNDFQMYYYDDNFNKIVRYNFLTKEITPLNDSKNFTDYSTSFDGKVFYIIEKDIITNKIYYKKSINKGKSFAVKILENYIDNGYLRLKTDHLGNIFIYDDKNILISSDQGSTWQNLTPDFPELISINDLQVSYDNYIYLATTGMGILKYKTQLTIPNKLKIFVYDDLNQNCIKDANEPPVRNAKVIVNGNFISDVDDNGEASFYIHKMENVVTLEFNEILYSNCESSYDANFSGSTNNLTLDIPLKAKRYCVDLKSGISTPFLRRCFDNTYYGNICNEGNIDAENVEVKIILDEFFDFVSVNLPVISQTGSEIILDAGTIESGDCKNITIKVNVSCDAALGQEHCIEIDAETTSHECEDVDSRESYVDCQPNIGSFDPNDKAIFVNGVRGHDYVEPGDKLEYMIRFQNTGTDTAFTVKIEDPISSKFDIASIRPVTASHEYSWSIENGTLKVVFNNILLVDSFKNEAASHGFIKFEIELHKETRLSEQLSNVAGIYFDFNEAVVTNTVITPVGKPVSTFNLISDKVIIYPNPSSDFITINVKEPGFDNAKVTIYNAIGEIVSSGFMSSSFMKTDVSALTGGYYLIQIVSKTGEFKSEFVKI